MNALIYVICDIQYTRRICGYHCYTPLNSFVSVNIKGMVFGFDPKAGTLEGSQSIKFIYT